MKSLIDTSLTPELKQNEEYPDTLSSTKQSITEDVRRRKSSPRTLSVRKISAGSEDSCPTKSSPRHEKKIPAKEHSSSDPVVSTKLSRNNISHKILKLNLSDPTETTSSSPKHVSRSKSPRKAAKDYFSSDPMDTSLSSQSPRLSSPRSKLTKPGKGEETSNQSTKTETHGFFSNTSNPKIILNCSPSNVQNDNSVQFFKLDLNTIISERTDEHFHGKVLAYFDPNLLKTNKPHSVYANRLKFMDYFKYINEDLTELQRQKYTTISSLVWLLNSVYSQKQRSQQDHDNFCENLLKIILCCMATSQRNCDIQGNSSNSGKTPEEKIEAFWVDAYGNMFSNMESRQYSELIDTLLAHFKTGFLMSQTLEELKNLASERPKDENPLSCVAWDYLNVLCDSQYSSIDLESCKLLYNEACNGLASEFVFVTHLWSFIRDNLEKDKELKHHSPWYETFKKLDKQLADAPVFSEYEPEVKNLASLNKWF